MRVYLDKTYRAQARGPEMFMSRLIRVLEEEHKVVFTSKRPHLSLGVISLPAKKTTKRIVRIDGCYYNRAFGGLSMNGAISKAIQKADGVIYQSNFSRSLCERLLEVKARKDVVIYNGVDQQWIRKIPAKRISEKCFAAVASWRVSKRPKSIVRAFLQAELPNSKLMIFGKIKKPIEHPSIVYFGNVDAETICSYLKSCVALVHLCKIESCPNAVIEALSCGIPIICNNIGGTPEIVGENGIVVDCDRPFAFDFLDDANLDNVDPVIVAPAFQEVVARRWSILRADLDIRIAARKYYHFFRQVLDV